MRDKAGRMFTWDELPVDWLVIMKKEEDSRQRSAWITRVEGDEVDITITYRFWSWKKHKRYRAKKHRIIHGRKSENGTIIDKSGRGIFVFEYVNLDGTVYRPQSDVEMHDSI